MRRRRRFDRSTAAKASAQGRHAIRRAWQRFGCRLTEADLRALLKVIGQTPPLWRENEHVLHVAVRLGDLPAVAAYDRRTKQVRTFLTTRQHLARVEMHDGVRAGF